MAGWPVTGRRRGGVLNITAAAWNVGFQWWRSGNIRRTQNVSEYMLVLALCLVSLVNKNVSQLFQRMGAELCVNNRFVFVSNIDIILCVDRLLAE